ncbi:MAG: HAD-IG family 5'-nucleotidase [Polyangiaceae bacterium]
MSDDLSNRRVFANRTLNMRSIRAVGFDMDYTLVHYKVQVWEQRAYAHARDILAARGLPVAGLEFDPDLCTVGLVLDLERGNLVKASRFGYVTRAFHGTRPMSFADQRSCYAGSYVDLREPRWMFLNTLFSLSEATLYAQCVDLLDAGRLDGALGYEALYRVVRDAVDRTHMEDAIKAEIAKDPAPFIEPDPLLVPTLLDLKDAGKLLMLITNSEWSYTKSILEYVLDPALPSGQTFRDVFDVLIVAASKPGFFTAQNPLFELVDDSGLLKPSRGPLRKGTAYLGGNARQVERDLELQAEDILYVGDHLYSDVHVTKDMLRWRTALVLRDLEAELDALASFQDSQLRLSQLMARKSELERTLDAHKLALQRQKHGRGQRGDADGAHRALSELRSQLDALDEEIAPLARAAGRLNNPNWGLIMRAGIDKSYLARQLERYADVYTSRVSNFSLCTPFAYLRAPQVNLPHDQGLSASD